MLDDDMYRLVKSEHVWLIFVFRGGDWAVYNGDDVVPLSFRPPSSEVGREVRGGGLAYVCRNSKEA